MTRTEILALAITAARNIWCESHDRLLEHPGNTIFQNREAQNWRRLIELELLWQREQAVQV